MGRALHHRSDEGSHDEHSLEREGYTKDRERDRERLYM